jgi:hypothetical protein
MPRRSEAFEGEKCFRKIITYKKTKTIQKPKKKKRNPKNLNKDAN